MRNGNFRDGGLSGWRMEEDNARWSTAGGEDGVELELSSTTPTRVPEAILSQAVTLAANATSARLSWRTGIENRLGSFGTGGLEVRVHDASGALLQVLGTVLMSESSAFGSPAWTTHSADLSRWIGQSIRIAFLGSKSADRSVQRLLLNDVRVDTGPSESSEFEVRISNDSVDPAVREVGRTRDLFWEVIDLPADRAMRWQVVTHRGGESTEGPVWNFRTAKAGANATRFGFLDPSHPRWVTPTTLLTLRAEDAAGNVIASENGEATLDAFAADLNPPSLLITEVTFDGSAGVELTHFGAEPLRLEGWKVLLLDRQNRVTPLAFGFPTNAVAVPGEALTLRGGVAPATVPPSTYYLRSPLRWGTGTTPLTGSATLVDPSGLAVDQIAFAGSPWSGTSASVPTLLRLSRSGPFQLSLTQRGGGLQRHAAVASYDAADWQYVTTNTHFGVRNPQLVQPLRTQGRMPGYPRTVALANGAWTGEAPTPVASGQAWFVVTNTSGALGVSSTFRVAVAPALRITGIDTVVEGGPRDASKLQVELPSVATEDTTVLFAASPVGGVTLPTSLIVPAGTNVAVVTVSVPDNATLEGSRIVEVRAAAPGFAEGSWKLTVADDETARLSFGPAPVLAEGEVGAIVLQWDRAPDVETSVGLASSEPRLVIVPERVIVPAGAREVLVPVSATENSYVTGRREIVLTASVTGWPAVQAGIPVTDNESNALALRFPPSVSESSGSPFPQGEARLAGKPLEDVEIRLSSNRPDDISLPSVVKLVAGESAVVFPFGAVNNATLDGRRSVTIAASGEGLTDATAVVAIEDDDPARLVVDHVSGPQFVGVPFSLTFRAYTVDGALLKPSDPSAVVFLGETVLRNVAFGASGVGTASLTLTEATESARLSVGYRNLRTAVPDLTVMPSPISAALAVFANDMVYHPGRDRLYVSHAGVPGGTSDVVLEMNPATLSVERRFELGSPGTFPSGWLALSRDGTSLHVTVNLGSRADRIRLDTGEVFVGPSLSDPGVPLPMNVYALAAVEGAETSVVASLGFGSSPQRSAVFDLAGLRPDSAPAATVLYADASGSEVVGANYLGGFRARIVASGLRVLSQANIPNECCWGTPAYGDGVMYFPDGQAYDTATWSLARSYRLEESGASVRARALSLGTDPHQVVFAVDSGTNALLRVFETESAFRTADVPIPAIGGPNKLIACGRGMYALRTLDQLRIVRSAALGYASAAPADLALSVPPVSLSATLGTSLSLPITVTNRGPGEAREVLWSFSVPGSLEFKEAQLTGGSWQFTNSRVTARLPRLPAGASAALTLVLVPRQPGEPRVEGVVRALTPDPDLENNQGSFSPSIPVLPGPDGLALIDVPNRGLAWDAPRERLLIATPQGLRPLDLREGRLGIRLFADQSIPAVAVKVGAASDRALVAISNGLALARLDLNADRLERVVPVESTGFGTVAAVVGMQAVPGADDRWAVHVNVGSSPDADVSSPGSSPTWRLFDGNALFDSGTGLARSRLVLHSSGALAFLDGVGNLKLRYRLLPTGFQQVDSFAAPPSADPGLVIVAARDFLLDTLGNVFDPVVPRFVRSLGWSPGAVGTDSPAAVAEEQRRLFVLRTTVSGTVLTAYDLHTLREIGRQVWTERSAQGVSHFAAAGGDRFAWRHNSNQIAVARSSLAVTESGGDLRVGFRLATSSLRANRPVAAILSVTNAAATTEAGVRVLLSWGEFPARWAHVASDRGPITTDADGLTWDVGELAAGAVADLPVELVPIAGGAVEWRLSTQSRRRPEHPETAELTVRVAVAVQLEDGQVVTVPLPVVDVAADAIRGRLYVSTQDGRLIALNGATGLPDFTLTLGAGEAGGPLALAEDRSLLHVATSSGRIRRLDLTSTNWTAEFGAEGPWTVLVARPGHPEDVLAYRTSASGTPESTLLLYRAGQPAVRSAAFSAPSEPYLADVSVRRDGGQIYLNDLRPGQAWFSLADDGVGELPRPAPWQPGVRSGWVKLDDALYELSLADLATDTRGRDVELHGTSSSLRVQILPDPAGRVVDIVWLSERGWRVRTLDRFTWAALADESLPDISAAPRRSARLGLGTLVASTDDRRLVFWTRRFSERSAATDLAVSLRSSESGQVGATSLIQLDVSNLGPIRASNVVASVWLPKGFRIDGTPGTDGLLEVDNATGHLILRWNELSAGSSRQVSIPIRSDVGGRFELRAAVRSESVPFNPADDQATLEYSVAAEAQRNALTRIRLPARDVVYSPLHRVVIASVGPGHDHWHDRLLLLDPVRGEVTRELLAVDRPSLLGLTGDNTALFAVVRGGAEVWRIRLPDGAVDQRIVLRDANTPPVAGSNVVALTTFPGSSQQVAVVTEFGGVRRLSFFEFGVRTAADLELQDENAGGFVGELAGIAPGVLLRGTFRGLSRWDLQGRSWVRTRATDENLSANAHLEVWGDRILLANGATFVTTDLSLVGYLPSPGQYVALVVDQARTLFASFDPSQERLVLETAIWSQGALPLAAQSYPTASLDIRGLRHWRLDGALLWTPDEIIWWRTDLIPLSPDFDYDSDGLSDAVERALGLDPHRVDGLEDTDGDGMNRAQELAAGTDPANPDDVLRAVAEMDSATTLRIRCTSVPGRRYQVEATERLGGAWLTVAGPTTATGLELSFPSIPRSPGTAGLFRVRVDL